MPEGYCVFPQINLASFIVRTDDAKFCNELFRNVDFLITDGEYNPKFIIEINDQTHLSKERRERDEKVQKICEEAGIPILKLWTSYGVNQEYIKGRVDDIVSKLPIARIHHFAGVTSSSSFETEGATKTNSSKKKGCYVATCVYGSYDCPEVWVLRRFRDTMLMNHLFGRAFVKSYYWLSPILVRWFGKYAWFVWGSKKVLNRLVVALLAKGFSNTPYFDEK